jgi:Fur family transcriptional regulator, ferric uptake regulator
MRAGECTRNEKRYHFRVTWRENAHAALREAGYKAGGARAAVIDALAEERCCMTVPDIHARVRRRRPGVGIASVYRALETLTELGLVVRLELGTGAAQYEPAELADHHHHLVCGDCGRVEAFSDDRLERVIDKVSRSAAFRIDEHDVVLRGLCRTCAV